MVGEGSFLCGMSECSVNVKTMNLSQLSCQLSALVSLLLKQEWCLIISCSLAHNANPKTTAACIPLTKLPKKLSELKKMATCEKHAQGSPEVRGRSLMCSPWTITASHLKSVVCTLTDKYVKWACVCDLRSLWLATLEQIIGPKGEFYTERIKEME